MLKRSSLKIQRNIPIKYNNIAKSPDKSLRLISPDKTTFLPTNQLTPSINNKFRNEDGLPVFSIIRSFTEQDCGLNAYTLGEYQSFIKKEDRQSKNNLIKRVRTMIKQTCEEFQKSKLANQQTLKRQHREVSAMRVELGDIAHKVMNKQKTNTFVRRPQSSSQHSLTLIRRAKESNPRTKSQKMQNIRQYVRQTGRKYLASACKRTDQDTRSISDMETSLDMSCRLSTDKIQPPQKLKQLVVWPKTEKQVFESLRRNINRQCFTRQQWLLARRDAIQALNKKINLKNSKHKRSGKFVHFSPQARLEDTGQRQPKMGLSMLSKHSQIEPSNKNMTKEFKSYIVSCRQLPVSIDML